MLNNLLKGFVVSIWICGSLFAAELGRPVTLTFEEGKCFPFPENITGAQDEVFILSYLFDDQLNAYKKLGVGMLRYPCGTPSDWLAWDDIENGWWPSDFEKKRNKLTPDAFISLCKYRDFTPLITVNTTLAGVHDQKNRINPTRVESIRKGAAYAARWVEHTNIKNKSGVKYWEIGNEVWIWMKEKEYPVHVREYARAMRKVDPSIKIIACGSLNDMEFNPIWLNFPEDKNWKGRPVNKTQVRAWTKALLRDARGDFDYIAPHIYIDGNSTEPIQNGQSLFSAIDDGERMFRQQIQWIQEEKSPVRLACTEWMINFHFLAELKDTQLEKKNISKETFDKLNCTNSPANAFVSVLGSADWIGKMIATGYVDIAIAHTLTFGVGQSWNQFAQKPVDPLLPKPAGLAIQFWNQLSDNKVMPVHLNDAPTYPYNKGAIPSLTAYATTKGNTVNVILINRLPDRSIPIAIPLTFNGKPAKKVTEHAIYAKSWGENLWQAIDDQTKYPFKTSTVSLDVKQLKAYEAKPCKLVRLKIEY